MRLGEIAALEYVPLLDLHISESASVLASNELPYDGDCLWTRSIDIHSEANTTDPSIKYHRAVLC